jgi:hypothetical protein
LGENIGWGVGSEEGWGGGSGVTDCMGYVRNPRSINLPYFSGSCITGVLPGQVCGLEATATECDAELLTATECTCEAGFNYTGLKCIGIYYTLTLRLYYFHSPVACNLLVKYTLAHVLCITRNIQAQSYMSQS